MNADGDEPAAVYQVCRLSARAASFRPEIDLLGDRTRVLVEQAGAIDTGRLGNLVGRVSPEQQWGIDEALMTVFGLR